MLVVYTNIIPPTTTHSTTYYTQHLTVDGKNGTVDEAVNQIAFADTILLNKIDLVTPEELAKTRELIRSINVTANIIETQLNNPECPSLPNWDSLMNVNSFSIERALQVDPTFMDSDDEGSDAEAQPCPDCGSLEHQDGHCKTSAELHVARGSGVGMVDAHADDARNNASGGDGNEDAGGGEEPLEDGAPGTGTPPPTDGRPKKRGREGDVGRSDSDVPAEVRVGWERFGKGYVLYSTCRLHMYNSTTPTSLYRISVPPSAATSASTTSRVWGLLVSRHLGIWISFGSTCLCGIC